MKGYHDRTSPDLIIPTPINSDHPLADIAEYHPPSIFQPPQHIASATVVDRSDSSISVAYPGGYQQFPIKLGQVTDYTNGDRIEFTGLNVDGSHHQISEVTMTYTPFESHTLKILYQQHIPPPQQYEFKYYKKMSQYIESMRSLLADLQLNDIAIIAYIKYYLDQHTFFADDKADIFQDIRDAFHVALTKILHSQYPAHQFGTTAVQQKKQKIQSILINSFLEWNDDDSSYFTILSFFAVSMALVNLEDFCVLPQINFYYLLQNKGIDTRRLYWLNQPPRPQFELKKTPKSEMPHQKIKTKDLNLIFERFFQQYYIQLLPKKGDSFSDINTIQMKFIAFMRATLSQLNCDSISIQSHLIALLSNVTVLNPFEEMVTSRQDLDCISKNILLTYHNIMRPNEDGISITDGRRENQMFSNNMNFISSYIPGILPNLVFFVVANYVTLYTNEYNQNSFSLFFSLLNTLLHQHLPYSHEFTESDNATLETLFDRLSLDLICTNTEVTFQKLFLNLHLRFSKGKKFIQPDPTLRANIAFFKHHPPDDNSDAFINSILKNDIDDDLDDFLGNEIGYL